MSDGPRINVRGRLASIHSEDLEHFPTRKMKALYFAVAIEAPSCWRRVLQDEMSQTRFSERQKRMMAAILRRTR